MWLFQCTGLWEPSTQGRTTTLISAKLLIEEVWIALRRLTFGANTPRAGVRGAKSCHINTYMHIRTCIHTPFTHPHVSRQAPSWHAP
jgi:hypothetical protein